MSIAGLGRPLSWVGKAIKPGMPGKPGRQSPKAPALSVRLSEGDSFHSASGGNKPRKGIRALLAGLAMAVPLAGVARAQGEDPGTTGIWENEVKVAMIEHDIDGGHARLVEETLMDYSGGTLRRDEIVKAEHPDVMLPLTEEQMQSPNLDREALVQHLEETYTGNLPMIQAMTDLIEGYYLFSDVLQETVEQNPDVRVVNASIGYAPLIYLYADYMPETLKIEPPTIVRRFMKDLMTAYENDPMLKEAREHYQKVVRDLNLRGIYVTVAAGNQGQRDLDGIKRHYNIDLPPIAGLNTFCFSSYVICVGAMDADGTAYRPYTNYKLAGFSSIGGELNGVEYHPTLTAPGVEVPIEFDNGYGRRWSGTSAASPYMAGLIAEMLAMETSPDRMRLKRILEESLVDNIHLPETHEGGGAIDRNKAVDFAAGVEPLPPIGGKEEDLNA